MSKHDQTAKYIDHSSQKVQVISFSSHPDTNLTYPRIVTPMCSATITHECAFHRPTEIRIRTISTQTTWMDTNRRMPSLQLRVRLQFVNVVCARGSVTWGQGVYGAQILVLVHKFTFKVVLGVIFSHRLSLLLNIQIENSDTFDIQFLKLVLPLVCARFMGLISLPPLPRVFDLCIKTQ